MASLANLPSRNTAQAAVMRRLALLGGWVSRMRLAQGLEWSEQRVDDELADLVIEGRVLFNPRGSEYRLAGSQLARQALQRLMNSSDNFALLARPSKTQPVMQMALARRAIDYTGGELLVMCDVEMPYSGKDPASITALCEAIANFERGLGEVKPAVCPHPTAQPQGPRP